MSQEDPKLRHGPPPKPTSGRPSNGTQGLKVVTIAPGSDLSPEMAAVTASNAITQDALESRPPPAAQPDPYIGCTIDNRYKVESLLGEGGMGIVYKCRHKIIDKIVAMKILRSDLARDKEVTERFLIEARAASSIGSDHIIDISDFGQLPDGSAYFVMEFLEGASLSESVNEGDPMPVSRILSVGIQLATGLAAAHEAGIVHRDLKPDNIILVKRGAEHDFVKILDFGIAKVTSGATGKLTQAGSVFGTPHYMSPEQAAGAPVDHRGDIYSFGVILYELACGRVPFDADNFMGILTQHMYKAPIPIRALLPQTNADVSPGLEAIILKCLSKRPEQRYQTMTELASELRLLADDRVPLAVTEMMERSGGFNVPADFFKNDGYMTGPVAATPEPEMPRRRVHWPLYAGIAAPVLIAATIFFAQSTNSTAKIGDSTGSAPSVPVVTEPNVSPVVGAAAPLATNKPAAAISQVVIGIDPLEAHAFADGKDLGQAPVLLNIPTGETMMVEIRHRGHKTQTISVDGSEPKIVVKLHALKPPKPPPAPRPAAPVAKPRKKKSTLGGGEIVNPWD